MTRFVFKESLQISCKPIKIYSLKLVTFFILGRYLAGTICFNVSSKSLARSRLVQLIATISGFTLHLVEITDRHFHNFFLLDKNQLLLYLHHYPI